MTIRLVKIQMKYEHTHMRAYTYKHAFESILARWVSACIHIRMSHNSVCTPIQLVPTHLVVWLALWLQVIDIS